MVSVTYVAYDGRRRRDLDVADGDTVMQAAVDSGVEGIVAECGGGLACATCHCYVDDAWIERVGQPSAVENDMLEATSEERKPTSRLSCQIVLVPALDGLVVHLPKTQY